jgi:hypothetical protein
MGGVVACAMMGSDCAFFHMDSCPWQLDIIIPTNDACPSDAFWFQQLLQPMGYELLLVCPKPGPYAVCTDKISLYRNAVCCFLKLQASAEQIYNQ